MSHETQAIPMLRMEFCPNCDYALNGLPDAGVCPECGKAYDQEYITLIGVARGHLANENNGGWGRFLLIAAIAVLAIAPNFRELSHRIVDNLFLLVWPIGILLALIERMTSDRRGRVEVLIWREGALQRDVARTSIFRRIGLWSFLIIMIVSLVPIISRSGAWSMMPWLIAILIPLLLLGYYVHTRKNRWNRVERDGEVVHVAPWQQINEASVDKTSDGKHRIRLKISRPWTMTVHVVDAIVEMSDDQAVSLRRFLNSKPLRV